MRWKRNVNVILNNLMLCKMFEDVWSLAGELWSKFFRLTLQIVDSFNCSGRLFRHYDESKHLINFSFSSLSKGFHGLIVRFEQLFSGSFYGVAKWVGVRLEILLVVLREVQEQSTSLRFEKFEVEVVTGSWKVTGNFELWFHYSLSCRLFLSYDFSIVRVFFGFSIKKCP